MPDYSVLLPPGSLTVEDAIKAGKKDITRVSRFILIATITAGCCMPLLGLTPWLILVGIILAIVASFLYTIWMTPQWRIWAYSGVADIHQFQRCAELELLLPKQSPMQMTGIMSFRQKETLRMLQKRFEEDTPFIDDPDVPQASYIYAAMLSLSDSSEVQVIINREGITTKKGGFYPWKIVWNEHVGIKSFSDHYTATEGSGSGYTAAFLCFCAGELQVEIPLSSLNVSAGKLDQLLYVHRGRYLLDQSGLPPVIPLKK